jgi:hypothetical protein
MLLSLEHVVDGSNVTNLTTIITQEILVNGSISNPNFISKKLMSFGPDGVSVFQGIAHLCYCPTLIPICSIHD